MVLWIFSEHGRITNKALAIWRASFGLAMTTSTTCQPQVGVIISHPQIGVTTWQPEIGVEHFLLRNSLIYIKFTCRSSLFYIKIIFLLSVLYYIKFSFLLRSSLLQEFSVLYKTYWVFFYFAYVYIHRFVSVLVYLLFSVDCFYAIVFTVWLCMYT